ncbi:hypothetical protein T4C_3637 [Trichinella pseudospiralis]|uniref:Uncharacterized protein n=1 Tax=Trichinella pseudospiralis TaxID=6337 RepID=A0A0V1IZR5_TRIPS|nr:hypothetical protein T4C_3637 [Trichinella pseudospiralis]
MDENLPSEMEGLAVWASRVRTFDISHQLLKILQFFSVFCKRIFFPCETESQIRKLRASLLLCTLHPGLPECIRQNCSPSSSGNCTCIQAKSQINYDCPTLTV